MEVFGGPKENPAGGCGCCKGAPTGGGGAKKIWKTERSPLWKLEEDPLKVRTRSHVEGHEGSC